MLVVLMTHRDVFSVLSAILQLLPLDASVETPAYVMQNVRQQQTAVAL